MKFARQPIQRCSLTVAQFKFELADRLLRVARRNQTFVVGRFDDCPAVQVQDAGCSIDLGPEHGPEIEMLRQAKFLQDLSGNAEIGFVLLDRPFPFRPIRRDAVLTIRLQGLDPTFTGRPDPQADAAAFEHSVSRIEIGSDLMPPLRASDIGRPRSQMPLQRVHRTVGDRELQLDLA